MLIAEDLLLLAYDDETGRATLGADRLDLALAGAVLIELTEAGRIGLEGEGRKGRLRVTDTSPTGQPVLDEWFQRIAGLEGKKPKDAVRKLTSGLKDRLLEDLAARGVLRREQGKVLGIFPTTSWPAVDSAHEDELRRRLHDILVTGVTADERTGAVVALLHAIDAVDQVVDKAERPAARKRAKELAEGDWASAATRAAVQDMTAAVMVAVIVPGIVAGGSGA